MHAADTANAAEKIPVVVAEDLKLTQNGIHRIEAKMKNGLDHNGLDHNGRDLSAIIDQEDEIDELLKTADKNGLASSNGAESASTDPTRFRGGLDGDNCEISDSRPNHNSLSIDGSNLLSSLDPNHAFAAISTAASSGTSSCSNNNADIAAVRRGESPTIDNVEIKGPPLFRRKDGSFIPYVGISERRLLPAPGSLDHWANADQSQSMRASSMISNAELHGLVSSALAHGGRSPNARASFSTRSPSRSSTTSHSPSESPKGPRTGFSSISHPLEELYAAATLQTVGVKPGLPLGRSFKWSPSGSRESSVSPKLQSVKPSDSTVQNVKNIPQLDCNDDYGSHLSSESNGTADGRSHRSAARHGSRAPSPQGRSPKRRARRTSESPDRSVIVSPHAAARFGNLDALKRLMILGGGVDLPNALSFTCLHMAASHGHDACVEWILSRYTGADIDRRSDQGWTALHLACRAGHAAVTHQLLEAGAASRLEDKHGRTPLHLACVGSSAGCVRELLDRDAEALRDLDGDRWGCVHYAARCNNAEVLQMLLSGRADPNLADNDGWTPLHNCARNGQRRCVETLLLFKADLLRTNRHRETPLHVACRCSKAKVITDLLDAAVKEQVSGELVQMRDFRDYTPSMACSSEDVRAAFEQRLPSLSNHNQSEILKSVSLKRLEEDRLAPLPTVVQNDRAVLAGASCIPSKFCSIM